MASCRPADQPGCRPTPERTRLPLSTTRFTEVFGVEHPISGIPAVGGLVARLATDAEQIINERLCGALR